MAKTHLSTAIFLSLLALPCISSAQDVSLQIEGFEPTLSPSSILNVHNTRIGSHNQAGIGVLAHYAKSPYVLNTNDTTVARPIEHRLTTEIGGSIGLFENFELGIVLPLVFQDGDIFREQDYSGFFLADARITPKLSFKNSKRHPGLGVGFALPIYLPTGRKDGLVGHKQMRVEPRIIVDYSTAKNTNIAFNLAYQSHGTRRINGYSQQNRVRLALAAETQLSALINLRASVFSDIATNEAQGDFSSPATLEGLAAVEFKLSPGLSSSLGGGIGVTDRIGVPLFRTFLSLSYSPQEADKDGDGVSDAQDQCPDDPEDADFYEDADGCPELDNDEDGIPDLEDSCTNEAEDKDGFVDSDGCPDPDNDQDGVLDSEDSCPDKSGLPANKGCPQSLGEMGGDNLEISKKIRLAGVEIQSCQDKLLERQPGSKGKLVVRFTINKMGEVVTTKVVENTVHDVFATCVTNVIQRISFPKKEATVERRFIVDERN